MRKMCGERGAGAKAVKKGHSNLAVLADISPLTGTDIIRETNSYSLDLGHSHS